MRVIQIVISLSYGDGVSSCILALRNILNENRVENIIAANNIDSRISENNIVRFTNCAELMINEEDIVIYHFCIGNALNREVENLKCKKILVYQNVTPPRFFRGIDEKSMYSCLLGELDAKNTVGNYLHCITMSEFSKNDLIRYGWKAEDISVIPLLAGTTSVQVGETDDAVLEMYDDEYTNIIFVGRVVMNKKIEDLITAFDYYQKNFNKKSRLLLVGRIGYENYYQALTAYANELKVENVVFANHVTDSQLESYFQIADVFLCMSEHEGFCMPLIEAMKRGVPVIGYKASAVPDTMGGAGIVVDSKDGAIVSEWINKLCEDDAFRLQVIEEQYKRANSFVITSFINDIIRIIREVEAIHEYKYMNQNNCLRIDNNQDVLWRNVYENLSAKIPKDIPIIIYGAGRIGKNVGMMIKQYLPLRELIFCDNSAKDETIMDISVINHERAVKKYKKGFFLITVQKAALDIVYSLACDGIAKENIAFFDNKNSKIDFIN